MSSRGGAEVSKEEFNHGGIRSTTEDTEGRNDAALSVPFKRNAGLSVTMTSSRLQTLQFHFLINYNTLSRVHFEKEDTNQKTRRH